MNISHFKGKPTFKPKMTVGYFIWYNEDGFHIRMTTKGKTTEFIGKISSNDEILDLYPFSLEEEDEIKLGPKKKAIHFKMITHTHIDGIDFKAKGMVTFDLNIGLKQAPLKNIFIGKENKNPDSNPFSIKVWIFYPINYFFFEALRKIFLNFSPDSAQSIS